MSGRDDEGGGRELVKDSGGKRLKSKSRGRFNRDESLEHRDRKRKKYCLFLGLATRCKILAMLWV